jgi:hypothetical protein
LQGSPSRGMGGRGVYVASKSLFHKVRPSRFSLDDEGSLKQVETTPTVGALEVHCLRILKHRLGDGDIAEAIIQ